MLKLLLQTDNQAAQLFLRVVLGGVMFAHGAQKLFGWFGGHGFSGTMNQFTEGMGIPAAFAFLAIMAESVGSLALIAGLFTRIAALGIGTVMVVAVVMVHWEHGLFMNWMGNQEGEGFEYHLLALGIAIALLIKGGGLASADRAWCRALQKRPSTGVPPAQSATTRTTPSQAIHAMGE